MDTKIKTNDIKRIRNKHVYSCKGSRPMKAIANKKRNLHDRAEYLEVCVPASQDYIGEVRHRAAEFARDHDFSKEDVDAVALAVGEAVDNAVKYSSRASAQPLVEMCCKAVTSDEIEFDITNAGAGFHPDLSVMSCLPTPESYCTHGRGFGLMSALMDELSVHSDKDSTTVHLVKRKSH